MGPAEKALLALFLPSICIFYNGNHCPWHNGADTSGPHVGFVGKASVGGGGGGKAMTCPEHRIRRGAIWRWSRRYEPRCVDNERRREKGEMESGRCMGRLGSMRGGNNSGTGMEGGLIDYNRGGILDYSKFNVVDDSEDREDKQHENRNGQTSGADMRQTGGRDYQEEVQRKSLFKQTPNKWNGGTTDIYTFRQHIKNIDVYLNMSATGIPGPYKAKDMRVEINPKNMEATVRKGRLEYTIIGGEFYSEVDALESYWALEYEPETTLVLYFKKRHASIWPQFMKGHPGINISRIHGAEDALDMQAQIDHRYNLTTDYQKQQFASFLEDGENDN
ncbi:hypothetical protein AAMO2058_000871200 [Amorphochlora amoebiformis]